MSEPKYGESLILAAHRSYWFYHACRMTAAQRIKNIASMTTNRKCQYATEGECLASRPTSLTAERALSYLPKSEMCPEWQSKYDSEQLPEGPAGLFGMIRNVWPDAKPTPDEAEWILSLQNFGSWRWLAGEVTGDCNQIIAMNLIEVSERVLKESGMTS